VAEKLTQEEVQARMYETVNNRWESVLQHPFVHDRPDLSSFITEVIDAYRNQDMEEITRLMSEMQLKFRKYPKLQGILQKCLRAK